MTNKQTNKNEMLIVAGTIAAVGTLCFVAGFIFGSKKEKRMHVTEKGELIKKEIEQE